MSEKKYTQGKEILSTFKYDASEDITDLENQARKTTKVTNCQMLVIYRKESDFCV